MLSMTHDPSAAALVRELVHADSGMPLMQCLDPAALMLRLQPASQRAANADQGEPPQRQAA